MVGEHHISVPLLQLCASTDHFFLPLLGRFSSVYSLVLQTSFCFILSANFSWTNYLFYLEDRKKKVLLLLFYVWGIIRCCFCFLNDIKCVVYLGSLDFFFLFFLCWWMDGGVCCCMCNKCCWCEKYQQHLSCSQPWEQKKHILVQNPKENRVDTRKKHIYSMDMNWKKCVQV